MQGFELTIPPTPTWTDMARDLVATGATTMDLGLDRFQDLLVVTTQAISEAVETPDANSVRVRMAITADRLVLTVETTGGISGPSQVSDMVLSVLADEHRRDLTPEGVRVELTMLR
jgi:hypothetical protein